MGILDALRDGFGVRQDGALAHMIGFAVVASALLAVLATVCALVRLFFSRTRRTGMSADIAQARAWAPGFAEKNLSPERREFIETLDQTRQGLIGFYRVLMLVVAGPLTIGGIYFLLAGNSVNGLYLVALILLALAFIAWARMSQTLRDETAFSPGNQVRGKIMWTMLSADEPILKITRTTNFGDPSVVKLDKHAIQTASQLIRAGNDMNAVCRSINPDYAKWGAIQKQLFRTTMQAVLKAQAPGSG